MAGIDNNTIVMLNGKLEDCSLAPKTIINNGVTISNEGKFGECYKVNTDKTLNFNANLSNEFTVEWFEYRTSTANHQYILSNNLTKNTKNIFMVGYNGSNATNGTSINFYYGVNESSFLANGTIGQIILNQWVHRAITYKNNSLKFYQNGILVNTFTVSNLVLNTLYLGGCWDTSSLNAIKIDEFRVSNICRYENNFEVQTEAFTINSPTIDISYQGRDKIEFGLLNMQSFSIESVEVFVNDNLIKTFVSTYVDLSVALKGLVKGNNLVVIKVNFDNKSVEKEINIYSYVGNDLSLKEVMDEFEKISLMDLSSADVKLYTALPNKVKNGQLAILCDNTDLEIILSSKEADSKNNCVFCYIGSIDENKKPFSVKNINLYFKYIHKIVNNAKSNLIAYVGINDSWVQVIDDNLVFYDNGQYPHYETKGEKLERASVQSPINITDEASSILVRASSSGSSTASAFLSSVNTVNLTSYSSLKVQIADFSKSGTATYVWLCVGDSKTGTQNISSAEINGNGVISLNVSNINHEAYCKIHNQFTSSISNNGNLQYRIKKMWLE